MQSSFFLRRKALTYQWPFKVALDAVYLTILLFSFNVITGAGAISITLVGCLFLFVVWSYRRGEARFMRDPIVRTLSQGRWDPMQIAYRRFAIADGITDACFLCIAFFGILYAHLNGRLPHLHVLRDITVVSVVLIAIVMFWKTKWPDPVLGGSGSSRDG